MSDFSRRSGERVWGTARVTARRQCGGANSRKEKLELQLDAHTSKQAANAPPALSLQRHQPSINCSWGAAGQRLSP